jgi:Accessory gene regulator B.
MYNKLMIRYCKSILSSEEISEFDAGILTIFLDLFDFTPIVSVSIFFFHNIYLGFTFIIVLSLLRQYTGGWHAKTIPISRVSYFVTFCICIMLLSWKISYTYLVLINVILFPYTFCFSPIEIPDTNLNEAQISIYKKKSIVVYFEMLFISLILFPCYYIYSNEIQIIILINTMLMIMLQTEKHMKGIFPYENVHHDY